MKRKIVSQVLKDIGEIIEEFNIRSVERYDYAFLNIIHVIKPAQYILRRFANLFAAA